MIVGSLTVIVYKQLEGGIFDLYELLPAFITAWIAIVLVSRLGSRNSKTIEIKFNEVQEQLKQS